MEMNSSERDSWPAWQHNAFNAIIPGDLRETRDPCLNGSGMEPESALRFARDDVAKVTDGMPYRTDRADATPESHAALRIPCGFERPPQ